MTANAKPIQALTLCSKHVRVRVRLSPQATKQCEKKKKRAPSASADHTHSLETSLVRTHKHIIENNEVETHLTTGEVGTVAAACFGDQGWVSAPGGICRSCKGNADLLAVRQQSGEVQYSTHGCKAAPRSEQTHEHKLQAQAPGVRCTSPYSCHLLQCIGECPCLRS